MGDLDEDDDEELTREKIAALIQDFLEQRPLYAPLRFETQFQLKSSYNEPIWKYLSAWPKSVTFRCSHCKRETTWQLVEGSNRDEVPFLFFLTIIIY